MQPIVTESLKEIEAIFAWLRDAKGKLTKACKSVCWDGCMFSNQVMMDPKTWNSILRVMIAVRDAHGWRGRAGGR